MLYMLEGGRGGLRLELQGALQGAERQVHAAIRAAEAAHVVESKGVHCEEPESRALRSLGKLELPGGVLGHRISLTRRLS